MVVLSENVMDDKKVTINEDEFHFTEAEEMKGGEHDVIPDLPDKTPGKINRRNILIAVGIVIVALSLYKLIDVFFGAEEKKPVVAVTTQPVPVAQPVIQMQPQVQQAPVSNVPDLTDQVTQLHQQDFATSDQMAAVTDQLNSLNATTQNLGNAVTTINQQLTVLSAQIQSTQTTVDALKPKPKPKPQVIIFKPQPAPPPQWYIQALIPGRAWLIQANGQTITVRQGDLLYGYGKVTSISVINGIVRTSSGIIIRFNNS